MLDLEPFCIIGDDGKRGLNKPFTVGDFTYAMDGHVMVRVPRRPDIEEREAVPVASILGRMTGAERALPISGLDRLSFETCGGCDGGGRVVLCGECKGEGVVTCPTCKHDHDCEDCNGEGSISLQDYDLTESLVTIICPGCAGQKRATETGCAELVPGRCFDPIYLALIASLPDCRIAHPDNAAEPSYFIFEGGDGLLMPMRADDNAPKLYEEPAQAEAA